MEARNRDPDHMRLAHLEIVCFGPPTVRVGHARPAPDVLWRKNLALLAYLALSPGRARNRDHLLGLLWPEKGESKARHSLNEAVRRLRTSLGPERLITDGDVLTLNGANLSVDALLFEALQGVEPDKAIAMLTGDFLEGLVLDDAPEFELWASRRRDHYRQVGGDLLVKRGEEALTASNFSGASDLAQRALGLNGLDELAVRLLIRSLALSGDSAGALNAGHRFTERLRDELGEHFSRETESLLERVRKGSWHVVIGESPARPVPLVGRAASHREAFELVEQGIAAGPVAIMIVGEPGAGKTRLVSECLNRAALKGARVALARPLESDADTSWSTFRALIRAGIMDAPGMLGADPDSLSVVAHLVPELADRFEPSIPRDNARTVAAIGAVMNAITDETPLVIAIDDAHFADGASIEALTALLVRIKRAPLLLIVTAPDAPEQLSRELLRLQSDINRGVRGGFIPLEPLSDEEVGSLVGVLLDWQSNHAERSRLARRIAYESGGVPLLAVELLRGFSQVSSLRHDLLEWPPPNLTFESPLPMTVPNLVRRSIIARILDLPEPARQVLRTASIGGIGIDVDLVVGLAKMTPAEIREQLTLLERHNFVRFDGDRYSFAARAVADVVQGEFMTRGERRMLRMSAIEILRTRSDLESLVLLSELLAELSPGIEVLEIAERAADGIQTQGSRRAAKRIIGVLDKCGEELASDAAGRVERIRARLRT